MIEAIISHLWQSTAFALLAVGLALLFSHHGAALRFRIWMAASAKFLIPFAPLVALGRKLAWHSMPAVDASFIVERIAGPWGMMLGFTSPSLVHVSVGRHVSVWSVAIVVWVIGFLLLATHRIVQWLKLRSIVRVSRPIDIQAPIPVRETMTALEPGICGVFKPVLLLPVGLAGKLAPRQLDAILAHEMCHWRRHDNLMAALHMLAEALFWFHPLIWLCGRQLIVERERACDEAVIESGKDRRIYAGSILKVCQCLLEPQMPCAAPVSGGSLRKRIEDIMTHRQVPTLSLAKRCLLAGAVIAAMVLPLSIGLVTAAAANAADAAAGLGTMKHYKSQAWGFELNIPARWNKFPPVLANSPHEVIRFESAENGGRLLIIFRDPYDPSKSMDALMSEKEEALAMGGWSNFVVGELSVGAKRATTLDFSRTTPTGKTVRFRHYFIPDGTILYALGFGAEDSKATFDLADHIAQSFVASESGD